MEIQALVYATRLRAAGIRGDASEDSFLAAALSRHLGLKTRRINSLELEDKTNEQDVAREEQTSSTPALPCRTIRNNTLAGELSH